MTFSLTTEEMDDLRAEARGTLLQWYTLTPTVLSAEDDDGQKVRTPGTVSSGWPCYYAPAGQWMMTDIGPVIRSKPELYVVPADPIAPGDLVTDILNEKRALINAGPYSVEEVHPGGGLLGAFRKVIMVRATRGTR